MEMIEFMLIYIWLGVAFYQMYYSLKNNDIIQQVADDLLLEIPMVTVWFSQKERLYIVYGIIVVNCLGWPIVLISKLLNKV